MRLVYFDIFPEVLEDDTLYISLPYSTSAHICPSGCGLRVVLPLGKGCWELVDDGDATLWPSVHVQTCNAHYWIEAGAIRWSTTMCPERAKKYSQLDQQRHNSEISEPSWLQVFLGKLAKFFKH